MKRLAAALIALAALLAPAAAMAHPLGNFTTNRSTSASAASSRPVCFTTALGVSRDGAAWTSGAPAHSPRT